MPKNHFSFARSAVARPPANNALHAQLVAGSREAIARCKPLLAATKLQIDMRHDPTRLHTKEQPASGTDG